MPPQADADDISSLEKFDINLSETFSNTAEWCGRNLSDFAITFGVEDWSRKYITCDNLASKSHINIQDRQQLVLYKDAYRVILSGIDIKSKNNVNEEVVPFFNRLKRRFDCRSEVVKDLITSDLLTYTGFESQHIHFTAYPNMKMKCGAEALKCNATFATYTILQDFVHMVVLEDTDNQKILEGMECQVIGNMLVAAMNRFEILRDHSRKICSPCVYGMLLWRDQVHYYKGTFSSAYLSAVRSGERLKYWLDAKIDRIRHGSQGKTSYSLLDANERKLAVEVLTSIKMDIEEETQKALD
ncbi:unnamed protein product [Umbelopsis vinacea]|jgi:hypothetical protein